MDALKQLKKDLTNETFINNWLKRLKLGFDVSFKVDYTEDALISYKVDLKENSYEKSYVKNYFLMIDLDIDDKLSAINKNKIHLTGNEDEYSHGLLRALYKITAMLKTLYNFIINPHMEMELYWADGWKNVPVNKQDCKELLYELSKSLEYNYEPQLILYEKDASSIIKGKDCIGIYFGYVWKPSQISTPTKKDTFFSKFY